MATDFTSRMLNSWRFSHCNDPCSPITSPRKEVIDVDLHGDLLTVSSPMHVTGRQRRLYASRAIDADTFAVFVVLAELPPLVADAMFFPAAGTMVVFFPTDPGQRRVRAVGTDLNSGACRGWIFDAVELGKALPQD